MALGLKRDFPLGNSRAGKTGRFKWGKTLSGTNQQAKKNQDELGMQICPVTGPVRCDALSGWNTLVQTAKSSF